MQFDAGPIISYDQSVDGFPRMRVAGPFIEQQADAQQRFRAVRPFYSRTSDASTSRTVQDFLWPWGSVRHRDAEVDWRFIPAYGHNFDRNDPDSRYRWAVFPVLFRGRAANGERYLAVFPLGGTLRDFLGRDKIEFVLFPVYARIEFKELVTHSVLWPVGSRTTGPGVHRYRVFPFYGYSHREGQWTKRFVAWPIWTSVRYHDTTDPDDGGFILFPFFGRVDVGERTSRMRLPPFFKLERAPGHWALNAPWPFIRISRGEIDRTYIWPLWGQRVIGARRSGYAMWPVVSWDRIDRVDHTVVIRRLFPFWYSEANRPVNGDDPVLARHAKLWPVFGYRREGDRSRFRVPELWPMRDMQGVERNWAPWWALVYRARSGEQRETEVLWGLYRHQRSENASRRSVFPLLSTEFDREADMRGWSALAGVVRYRREGVDRQLRLLYVLKLRLP